MAQSRCLMICAIVLGIGTAAMAATFQARCPRACSMTPGGRFSVPIDIEESEYACCIGGSCRVCDDCPWYLEWWC